MSAIFGIMNSDGNHTTKCDLVQMDAALAQHGPDDGGIWCNDSVGLGQRLMCFTPEDHFEQQPLISQDGLRVLVTDARIDNRQELTVQFALSPSETMEMPDSAFIMLAYEKWGLDCPSHLIGTFAFALWDKREKHLLLVRSPLSDRHIYYHSTSTSFTFSTVPKGLFVLERIPCELNQQAFADYLVLAPEDPGSSFYRDVFRVQMGSSLVVGKNGIKHHLFWKPDYQRELKLNNDNDYVEAFTELFERVIADHLRSITPVGVMMSGGLDSSSVAAVAASQLKLRNQRLTTFTEIPRKGFFDDTIAKGRYADETPLVQKMADAYDNIDVNLVQTDGIFFLNNVTQLFDAAGVPFYAAPNKVWIDAIHAEAQQQNVKVLLTGGSGNMTISWNGSGLVQGLLKSGRLFQAWHETNNTEQSMSGVAHLRAFISRGLLPMLPSPVLNVIMDIRHKKFNLITNNEPWNFYSSINQTFAKSQRVIARSKSKGFDFSLRSNHNTKITRYSYFKMADIHKSVTMGYKALYGVESRDPTMDVRIFDFCLSVPEDQYCRRGKDRWLIRRALSNRLPKEIVNNTQRGLQAADWLERLNLAHNIIDEELNLWKSNSLPRTILDIGKLRNIFNRICSSNYTPGVNDYYQSFLLQNGLMNGRFLRWLEAAKS